MKTVKLGVTYSHDGFSGGLVLRGGILPAALEDELTEKLHARAEKNEKKISSLFEKAVQKLEKEDSPAFRITVFLYEVKFEDEEVLDISTIEPDLDIPSKEEYERDRAIERAIDEERLRKKRRF